MKVKEITRKCSKTNYEGGILYRVSFTDIPDYAKNMWREHSAEAHMALTEPVLEMQAVITPNKKLHDVNVGYQFNSYVEFPLEAIDTIQMADDFIKTVDSEGNVLPDAYNPQTGEIMGDIEWNELVTDLKKTEQLKSISLYFQLMNDRPEEFANTGLINIEKNIDKLSISTTTDNTKRIDNQSNPKSERLVRAGVKYMGKENDLIIKAGEYTSRSMSVAYDRDVVIKNGRTVNDVVITANWRTNQNNIDQYCDDDLLYINSSKTLRRFVTAEEASKGKTMTDLLLDSGQNQDGTNELIALFGKKVFDTPKPEKLLCHLIKAGSNKGDIVLDFFM